MDEITKSEFKKLLAVVEETKNQSQDFKDGLHLGFKGSIEIKRAQRRKGEANE